MLIAIVKLLSNGCRSVVSVSHVSGVSGAVWCVSDAMGVRSSSLIVAVVGEWWLSSPCMGVRSSVLSHLFPPVIEQHFRELGR